MTIASILLALIGLGVLALVRGGKDKKAGQTEQKLEQAEKVLKNVKKANGAWARLTPVRRRQLRRRYGRE